MAAMRFVYEMPAWLTDGRYELERQLECECEAEYHTECDCNS